MRKLLTQLRPTTLRGHHRRRWRSSAPARSTAAWSSSSSSASTARRRSSYPHPALEPILERHLRRHRLPGAGDADRAGARRLLARRRRQPAPRHGQEEDRRRWTKERERFIAGRRRGRASPRSWRGEIFDQMETFAAYGFNKSHSAAYALCLLPDRLPQGALPGGVHGRAADRWRWATPTRRTRTSPSAASAASASCRPTSTRAARTSPCRRTSSRSASASGAVNGVGAQGDRGDPRRARADGPFTSLARLLPARAQPAGEPAGDREPDQVRRLRLAASATAPRLLAGARRRHALGGAAAPRSADSPQIGLFAGARGVSTRRRRRSRTPRPGAPRRAAPPSARRSASSSPAIRSTATSRTCSVHERARPARCARAAPSCRRSSDRARPRQPRRASGSAASSTPSSSRTARRATATPPSCSRTRRASSR